ncbi:MAG TPA: CHASE3 domain-containing protein [Verrucomicrobiae bacterium]|nr:CHASE3 domain-containing protein [Verrucomicrobiae bacterium]
MITVGKVRRTVFWLGLFLPVFALVLTIWVAHVADGQVNTAFTSVTHTYKTLNLLEETQAHVADAETGQRGYLLTSRDDYFALYDNAMSAANEDVQELKDLVRDNPAEEQNVANLQSLISKRLGPNPEDAAFKKNPSGENAVALTDQGRDTMNQFRSLLYRMREEETELLAVRQQQAEQRFILDQTLSLAFVAVTAIALIAVVAIVLRLEHLRQIVTICAWTGQVKHEGEWIPMESYLKERFGLSVSHGLSREAAEKMTRDMPRRTPKAG